MGIAEIIQDKRDDILRIAAKHGVKAIRLFGSVARGEARPDSDVDFLGEVGPVHSPFCPGGLVADLEVLLGRRVEVVEPDGIYPPLRSTILGEAVSL